MPQPAVPHQRPAREQIAKAALELLGDSGLEDLVRVLTPERLAATGPWSSSTVRYHFGGARDPERPRDFGFQRRALALSVLELALASAELTTSAAVARWRLAAAEFSTSGTLEPLLRALMANVAAFVPGGSDDDISARARAYHLAIAVADEDRETAQLLRRARLRQIDAWAPAMQSYVTSTGRVLRPGRSMTDVLTALFALFDGNLLRLRFDATTPSDWFAEVALAIIGSFTAPRAPDGGDDRDGPLLSTGGPGHPAERAA